MRVGRVAGEHDPALAVGVGESSVHREQREPLGVAEPQRAPGAFRHDLPESFENLLVGWLFVVAVTRFPRSLPVGGRVVAVHDVHRRAGRSTSCATCGPQMVPGSAAAAVN
jgi:hypothetical protein